MYLSGSQVLDGDKREAVVMMSIDMKGWEKLQRKPRVKTWLETKEWAEDVINKIPWGWTTKISPTEMAEHKGSKQKVKYCLRKKMIW